jgi:putative hydrolase of the HAD superfamily
MTVLSKLDISKFEAVIFDLDSTLTNTHQYPFLATNWLLKESGIDSEGFRMLFMRTLFTRYLTAIQDIVEGAPYRSVFDIVHTAMVNSLEDLEKPVDSNLVYEAASRFKSFHLELSSINEGVIGILDILRSKEIKLGVLSNSFEGHARIILTNLELVQYFSSIVDCGDVNAYKPMKAPFEKVLSDLSTDSSKSIYVGDEYYADMVGAKSVGMTSVWINHRERSLEDQVAKYGYSTTPDFVLNSITEFIELL